MRKATESKKEKIINFYKENKNMLGEFIAVLFIGFIYIFLFVFNLDIPHDIKIMLCIILLNVLIAQFYAQNAYYGIKELKKQEKNK